MNLSLERVLRFVAVAEHLSFTRAATVLGIDQPWLSRQVMQLEEQLGFMLFDRSASRIALTPEGLEFLRAAQQLAEASQRVRQKAEEMSRRIQSVLRIGTAYATYPLKGRQRLLNRFAALRPNVSLELSAYEWSEDVLPKLIAGEVDFGVILGPIHDPDFEVCVLDELYISLAIPKEDPLAEANSVALSDLAGRRVAVAFHRDTKAHRYLNAYSWMEEVGAVAVYVPEGRRFVYDTAEGERLIVLSYALEEQVPPGFIRRPIDGPRPQVTLVLVRSRRTMSPAGERFWRLGRELDAESPKVLEDGV